MSWKPSTAQLETVSEMGNARLPNETIAAMLNVGLATFKRWAVRTSTAVAPEPVEPPPAVDPQPSVQPPSARVVAERMFEAAGE